MRNICPLKTFSLNFARRNHKISVSPATKANKKSRSDWCTPRLFCWRRSGRGSIRAGQTYYGSRPAV
jgi:hypothetical protein